MLFLTAIFLVSGVLLFEVIKLSIKVAWGITKVIAWVLSIIALPLLIILAVSTGGLVLLLPVGLLVAAFSLLFIC